MLLVVTLLIQVSLLCLPSLGVMDKSPLLGDIIPRSLLITQFETVPYLFVSIGDGTLFYYQINGAPAATLGDKKKVQLGTQPTNLVKFTTVNGSVRYDSLFDDMSHTSILELGICMFRSTGSYLQFESKIILFKC